MSPYQHGEVFVTDDGTEADLDLGHYERFIDINLNKYSERYNRQNLFRSFEKRTSRRLSRCNGASYSSHHEHDQKKSCVRNGDGC